MFEITLDPGHQTVVKVMATLRYEVSRAAKRVQKQVGKQEPWDIEQDGLGGEMAAASIFNVFPQFSLSPDSGWDIMLNDKKIDVNTTEHENGHLLCRLNATKFPDLYMLMIGVFPVYRCAGWATPEELCRKESIKYFGKGGAYALAQEELHPPEELPK